MNTTKTNHINQLSNSDKLWFDHQYAKQTNSIYISMTSIPDRFMNPIFENNIKLLIEQQLCPTMIFISIPTKYNRNFVFDPIELDKHIDYIQEKYKQVRVIRPVDYGPATKLMGLMWYGQTVQMFDDSDIIVVVDDDMEYSDQLIATHSYAHQLYQTDLCVSDQTTMIEQWIPYKFRQCSEIFYKSSKPRLYGFLGWSIKYGVSKNIFNFYDTQISKCPSIIVHDDCLFSAYVIDQHLTVVETTVIPIVGTQTQLDTTRALRNESGRSRSKTENEIYSIYSTYTPSYKIKPYVGPRNIRLVDKFRIISPDRVLGIYASATYMNPQMFLLTITLSDSKLLGKKNYINIELNNISTEFYFTPMYMKQTYILGSHEIKPLESSGEALTIMQINCLQTQLSENKFESIVNILTMAPQYPYRFFDDAGVSEFLQTYYTDIISDVMDSLMSGTYKADFFRYCYLYIKGGIYIDCKKIAYVPMDRIVEHVQDGELYVRDISENDIFTAFIITPPRSDIMFDCIVKCCKNVITNDYKSNALHVTGPCLLGEAVHKKKDYVCKFVNIVGRRGWQNSTIVDASGYPVFLNSYAGYYDENNYLKHSHYSVLWKNRKIFGPLRKPWTFEDLSDNKILNLSKN